MRLLAGLLAAQPFECVLSGDESLSRRPMRRVTEPLAAMGARIDTAQGGTPPLRIRGHAALRGIRYELPVASAQVKSALLLAGLYAQGETCVREPAPTRDHTERMLDTLGWPTTLRDGYICVRGDARLRATRIDVPADISSAAFFMVGAAIAEGADVLLPSVGINPTRTGVLDILRLMGADIELLDRRMLGGEPVADVRVQGGRLRGIDIPVELVPLAIDEFPPCSSPPPVPRADRAARGRGTAGQGKRPHPGHGRRSADPGHRCPADGGRHDHRGRSGFRWRRRGKPWRSSHRHVLRRRLAAGERHDRHRELRQCGHLVPRLRGHGARRRSADRRIAPDMIFLLEAC